MAGVALQLRAMTEGTAALPAVDSLDRSFSGGRPWPMETRLAMLEGVRMGLAAAIAQASIQFLAEEPGGRLVLTGGDAVLLDAPLKEILGAERSSAPLHWPDLPVEALVQLRPAVERGNLRRGPDPSGSDRPSTPPSP